MERSIIKSAPAEIRPPQRQAVLSPPASSAPPGQRLVSLDTLRGFAMFWIVGGRELVLAIVACLSPALVDAFETQMTHPVWEGFVAWDMIMPVFLFVVGTSMPFAFGKRIEQGVSLSRTYGRVFCRVALLWILGILAQGSLLRYRLEGMELFSNTLQAIAVGYLVASMALLHLSLRAQIGLFVALTLGYWAVMRFVSFDGHPAGLLEREANFALYVDQLVLGRFRRDHSFTWIVTSLGFAATVVLGTMAGHLLRGRLPVRRKLVSLVGIGLVCMAAGWLWSYWVPLNRHLWTSSTILWTGGWGFLLVALFYGVIDVGGIKRWTLFFVVLGANALLAYVLSHVFDRTISDMLVGELAKQWPEASGELLRAVASIAVLWTILWYLYRNRTFLRA